MPRRKPISTKQRKEELKEKRAIKRGDIPAPPPASSSKTGPKRGKRRIKVRFGTAQVIPGNLGLGTKRLESKFGKLSPEWLERAKLLASTEILKRPIPTQLTILPDFEKIGDTGGEDSPRSRLACPKRPKWRYDMEKKEVEKNEEGLFAKWIAEVDNNIEAWRSDGIVDEKDEDDRIVQSVEVLKRSPTYFERNLEVWRQLWRVAEISQILMILLDIRAPTVHFPPSLQSYVTTLRPARKIIVVFTKTDLVSAAHVTAWRAYFASRHPEIHVIQVEAYKDRPTANDTTANDNKGKTRKRYVDPHIPSHFLKDLVQTLKCVHKELLEPPEWVKHEADQEKRKSWKPRVRESVDWDRVLDGTARPSVLAPAVEPKEPSEEVVEPDSPEEDAVDLRYITVGLIGQPNAGKSSLLNALFGKHIVKASRTPGKTKHFQTLFWTPEIRLVDCPGLVIPNYVPMETQVLSAILPISQISSLPSCIQHAARLMPLEEMFGLAHPSTDEPPAEDKRTWREGTVLPPSPRGEQWTAMDVMTAYANKKGWVTAKAGRPDVNRAGNAILRTLAEGRVKWAFWPPGYQARSEDTKQGIWLSSGTAEGSDEDSEFEDESEQEMEDGSEIEDDRSEEENEEESTGIGIAAGAGRFSALALADSDADEDEDP